MAFEMISPFSCTTGSFGRQTRVFPRKKTNKTRWRAREDPAYDRTTRGPRLGGNSWPLHPSNFQPTERNINRQLFHVSFFGPKQDQEQKTNEAMQKMLASIEKARKSIHNGLASKNKIWSSRKTNGWPQRGPFFYHFLGIKTPVKSGHLRSKDCTMATRVELLPSTSWWRASPSGWRCRRFFFFFFRVWVDGLIKRRLEIWVAYHHIIYHLHFSLFTFWLLYH